MSYTIPLMPGEYYHIYNRGINGENIFIEETNYHHFLKLYTHYIHPHALTFAYCLLRNHFHLLIFILEIDSKKSISQAFSNMFNAYSKAFNLRYNRHGSLFERPFKRKPILHQNHLIQTLFYIHANPIKHKFTENLIDWPFSSYHSYLETGKTKIATEDAISWYNNRSGFFDYHKSMLIEKIEPTLVWEGDINKT